MNFVPRTKLANNKLPSRNRNELVRKDTSLGIRGNSVLPVVSYNPSKASRPANNAPRYHFNNEEPSTAMGPPLGLPRSAKRRYLPTSSSSAKPESSWSGRHLPRVLASDSAVDTSDFCTPRNRPTALRYISSSSRGGHSGTRSARSTSTSAVEPSVILAISEGRGMARGEIGMAAVDLRHPHLVLCQFSDTLLYVHTLTKINYFNPIEIIVPHTFCEGTTPSQLYQLIKDHYPLVNLTTVQRRHFNDAAGRQQIQTLCAPQYSAVYLQVLQKFYALTAAAAVLKYVEYIQCIVFARESLKIEYHSSENTMIIDVGTATQLELVHPLTPSAGATCCLLGVLGPTFTVGGIRALRAAILQPSCKKEVIENRLDAVQDLMENETGLMTALQDVIKKLSEVDKILLLCMESQIQNMDKVGEAQLNQTLLLKTTMELVPKLVEALEGAHCGRLKKIKMEFENPHYKEIADQIRKIIQDDAHLEKGAMGSLQRCFAVKPDINGLLDVARRTYSELIEDIQKIVEQLAEESDLPIRLNQNMMKGFHIVMPVAPKMRRMFSVEDLPPIFIQVHFNGASVTMTTEELVVLDQQAKESLNEIQKMSSIVISSLLKELRPFMSSLYKLCENIAELDILLALANASTIGSYIRPEFSSYLDVRNCVHPLLDYNSQVMPVPNDILATPEHNFTIMTGPNMGGKSIYIKQVALMQIMAQLGCFLPATNAVLRLCDRLFSRIGFNDSVELNASTYVYEMKEMQHIITGLTSTSLVIIDELCRGTCAEEGTGMAWAICEELLSSDAFVFFTTHFTYLTRLEDLYCNVVNRHTSVTEEETNTQNKSNPQRRLVYNHKIEPGASKIEHYGLALAAKTNLPEGTVKLAMELAEIIRQNRKDVIKKLSEVDKILLLCMESQIQNMDKVGEAQLNQTLLLKTTMELVPKLVEALEGAHCGRLKKIKMEFENPHYKEIADQIRKIIQDDAHLEKGAMGSLQRCFAVKPDINGLLDVARRTYSELIEDIQKIVEQLAEEYDLPIRLNQNMMKGFHIVMPVAPKMRRMFSVEDLPPIFIQVHFNGASVTMTTEELVVLDQQAKESLNEIQKMSSIVISSLLKELRPFMSSLYKLCENIAELDILLALANASTIGSYIRPEFSSYLDVRNCVHPLLDYNSQVMPVPNDVLATPEHNFTIMTGPNMGGKSIYIKQVALMQIMAQLGCFLPATNAVLRLCDRLFSRIGFNDSVELNASTYVYEMKEMQHIITGLTSTSLVIIDELCRGTCAEEGTGMAWAICEELLSSDAFVFFTTHFTYLTRLEDLYCNVVNRHTSVTEEETNTQNKSNPQRRLVYNHKIEPGASKIENYGLALAAKTNLPEGTVKLAMELAEIIGQNRKPQEVNSLQVNDETLLYNLNAEVRLLARKGPNSDGKIKEIIKKFKEDHPQLIERIRIERSVSNRRTDSSANVSNNNSNNYIPIQRNSPASKESGSLLKTPPQRIPIVICSASDENSDCNTNVNNKQLNKELHRQFQYAIRDKKLKPTVIYSTTSDDAETEHSKRSSNYLVKSSNELLTSVMNINMNGLADNDTSNSNEMSSKKDYKDEPAVDTKTINFEVKKVANEHNNNTTDIDLNMDDNATDTDFVEGTSISSDSDIAEALTQVIESIDESNAGNSDEMSIDEELMRETIDDINKDLARNVNIDDIILTPPVHFRD